MKNLLKGLMVMSLALFLANCTTENLEQELAVTADHAVDSRCSSQNPKARITNNSSQEIDFEIFDDNGILIGSAYNIPAGLTTTWKSFSAGVIEFKVSTVASEKGIMIDMGTCMGYDVSIDANNQLDTDQPITF